LLKVGIIGIGTVGRYRANLYSKVNEIKLVGLADKHEDKVLEYTQIFGVKAYSTLEELVAAENPDLIDICLPTHLQKEVAVKAAELGKHVFCQAPMAYSEADANEMIVACQKAGVQLLVSNPLHFSPEYVKVKNLIDRHSIGNVGTVRIIRDRYLDRYEQGKSSGLILQSLIHHIEWLQSIFGNIKRVYAKRLKQKTESIDVAYVSLRFENGLIAHINANVIEGSSKDRIFLEAAGDKGVLSYHSEDAVPIYTSYFENIALRENRPVNDPYLEEIKELMNQVSSYQQDGQVALNALKCGLAVMESLKSNEVITLLDQEARV